MKKIFLFFVIILLSFAVKAQITLSGIVFDSTNSAIPYANVYHPSTMQGTVTDGDGAFYLRLYDLNESDSILFSWI